MVRKPTIPGLDGYDAPDEETERPGIETPRAVDPADAAKAAEDDRAAAVEPVTPDTPAPPAQQDALTVADIASQVPQAPSPGTALAPVETYASDDPRSDIYQLMQARYHQDPAAIQQQLAAASGGAPLAAGGAPGTAAPSVANVFQQKLIELMNRSTVPSATDPEIAATLNASRLAGQRAFDRDSAQLAEQMAATGMSGSGAVGTALAGLRANRAETEQNIAASTFRDAANRRVAELQQTLELAGNRMNEQERNAIQLQIAQLQDATDRAQISEGGRQFDADLAEKIREYGLDAAYRDAALGASGSAASASNSLAQQRIDEDKRQFNESLAFDKDKWLYQQNSNPILSWLQQAYGGV